MRVVLAAVAVLLCLAQGAMAQSKDDKIAELIRVQRMDKLWDDSVRGIDRMIVADLKTKHPELPPEFLGDVGTAMGQELAAMKPLMIAAMIDLFRKHISEEEIDAMIAFYGSPVGQSIMDKLPIVMRDSMGLMQQLGPQLEQRLVNRVRQLGAARGYRL